MIISFDTEFTDLVADAKLISIGLVSEDGREFYAEISDGYEIRDCSEFVQEVVLPLLEGGEKAIPHRQVRDRLRDWLEAFGDPVTLATDSLAWDWPWIQAMFRTPGRWPANLDRTPALLRINYLNDYDAFEPAVEHQYLAGLRRHHALDDARANMAGFKAAGGLFDGPGGRGTGRFTV